MVCVIGNPLIHVITLQFLVISLHRQIWPGQNNTSHLISRT